MRLDALPDSGSMISIISRGVLEKLTEVNGQQFVTHRMLPKNGLDLKVKDASGNIMEFLGAIRLPIKLKNIVYQVHFFIQDKIEVQVLFGTNLLEQSSIRLDDIQKQTIKTRPKEASSENSVTSATRVVIPPRTHHWVLPITTAVRKVVNKHFLFATYKHGVTSGLIQMQKGRSSSVLVTGYSDEPN